MPRKRAVICPRDLCILATARRAAARHGRSMVQLLYNARTHKELQDAVDLHCQRAPCGRYDQTVTTLPWSVIYLLQHFGACHTKVRSSQGARKASTYICHPEATAA